jgi:small-conductance mechanosensitive channel
MEQPLTDRIVTGLSASAEYLGQFLPSLAAGAAALLLFWGLASIIRRVSRLGDRYVDDPTRRNLIRQVVYYALWIVGVIVALNVAGVNAQSVLTGLGLGGIALGFALKDIVSNLVSGLLILVTRAVEIDDQVVVGETEGTVERIEVRATHVRTYDGRLVLVPNGEVFTSRITNNTESPLRRATVRVHLDYRQDLARALTAILDAVKTVEGVVASPAASIRLSELGLDRLFIDALFWTDSRRRDFMNTASEARIAIVAALKAAGVELPAPELRFTAGSSATPAAGTAREWPSSSDQRAPSPRRSG